MPALRTIRLLPLFLFVFLQANYSSFSQTVSYPYKEWVKKLSSKNVPVIPGMLEVFSAFEKIDSSQAISILNELEKKGASEGEYFTARFNFLKATWLWNLKGRNAKESIRPIIKKALNAAYETDNDSLVSIISFQYGSTMYYAGEIEPAAMYCLYSAEIDEKISREIDPGRYTLLGDILYTTRDYERSIYYTRLAIQKETDTSFAKKDIVMSRYNTIALCWQKTGNYDSAFFYFDIAMKMAGETKNRIWENIISGNKGQIYYALKNYAVAKALLETDYRESKAYGELGSAANSLQWIARINLIRGKKDSALMQVKEAMLLLQQAPNNSYLQNVYYAAADVYRAIGNSDSVYKYSQLYTTLHDAAEKSVANSRLEISQIKLDNLQNELTIKNLHKEREAEKLKRNLIITLIVMLAVIGLLILNRQRQKFKYKQELALQEKNSAEAEMAAAKEQLQLFTQNIIEKTVLIESLQVQLLNKELTKEQQQLIEELSGQTIVTEDQWNKFKSLYEKIYPGFFAKLKLKAPDITVAEQRMAALMRLQLTNSQMASMLGISGDSVRKTRLRLRQRLNLTADTNVEELIAGI